MRTKLVLGAALLAAGLATSMAQNVYSLNVVGYVNVTLPPQQFTAVANPLDASVGVVNGNDIANLFSIASTGNTIAPGSSIATFNSAANDYDPAIAYSGKSSAWVGSITMAPGTGALYYNGGSVDTVVTFVGEVKQGTYTVNALPSTAFTLAGAPVPIPGEPTVLNTSMGLVSAPGDSIATFNSGANDWNTAISFSGKSSSWVGTMPVKAGEGFLYYNAGAGVNTWVSNFTVQ